jgi:hypothetical protein
VKRKTTTIGFGFDAKDAEHHFVVDIPTKGTKDCVRIYERFSWSNDELASSPLPYSDLKVRLDSKLWSAIATPVARTFNARLTADGKPSGRWSAGRTVLERLLGKELVLLAWAIDGNDVGSAGRALRNWQVLTHEERWWLYTMTNATSRSPDDNKHWWRRAIAFALCEDPVVATTDEVLFDEHANATEGAHGQSSK